MNFTASDIAKVLNGEIDGNPDIIVNNLAKIDEGKPKTLSFLANEKYTKYVYSTESSIVIVNKTFVAEKEVTCTLIRVEDSRQAFTTLLEFYDSGRKQKEGIEQPVFISETAKYGKGIYLGAFSYLGENVKIGDNVKIYPNVYVGDNTIIEDNVTLYSGVKLYSETVIGNNSVIHAGSVIGSDGFGFAPNSTNEYKKMPQVGNVVIKSNVEIGACTTIDRAMLGSTVIGKGVKLDNQIQVAHNVEIGENTVIAAQTGLAGTTKVGKNCMIGGQVGFAGHISIGDNVKIAAQSGIMSDIKEGETVQGSPTMPIMDFYKSYVHFTKLPSIVKRVQELEKQTNNK